MATAYQIRLAQAAGDLDEDKLKKLGIAQLNSQLSNANSATAQATAAAVKQATNPTAAQAGIKGAAGVGATVAGAIPMANTPNLPVNPNTPEQKYLANYTGSAGASGTTATAQPTQQKDYLFFGTQDPNFKLGMSAEDQASWNAIGQKYAAGDQSWNRDTNQFREDGNWSGYYDDSGNYNGWLRAVDGTGGYTPAFGGKVGETGYAAGTAFYAPDGTVYTLGADGSFAKSGNATTVKYGSYIGPKSGYQDSEFWALNSDGQYQRYTNQTAPDEVLEAQGYYRDANGLVMPIDDQYRMRQALKNGDITPEQAAMAQAIQSGYTPSTPQTVTPSVSSSGSTSRSTTTRETTPTTVTPQQTQPVQQTAQTVNTQAAASQSAGNPYQAYLDQWSYEAAPEWNENPPETWREMQNYDYGQAPEYQGSPYDQQRDEALAAAGEKWTPSEYQQKRDAALQRAEDMRFSYDPNTDPNWQAYQKQYRREGDRAMQEALAQASMRTGGLANSYAVTAASQAGNYYASQLSDKLPELYQDAYNRYLQEFQRQLGISDQYQGFDDREYSRWADQQGRNFDLADRYNQYGQQDYSKYQNTLDQYNRDRNFQYGVNRDAVSDELNNYGIRYNQYQDRLGQYNTDRNFDYGRYRDAVGDARYADETAYNRNYQAQRDAINDQRYDQEWAQQLREYADTQGWKQKDWDQYLREYGDKLSEQEREWAYQMSRDAVSDARYADETAYNRGKYEDETAYQRAMYDREYADEQDQNAWERDYKQTAYNDAMKREALDDLYSRGYVAGIYADILGVPAGTTIDQYEAQYGRSTTSPFEETEIDSGKPYSGGGYDESGGGDDKGGSTYTGSGKTINVDKNGNMDLSGENLDKAATNQATGTTLRHENGKTMTEGFRLWWPKIRRSYDDGASVQQIAQKISNLYEQGVIAEYEIDIILDELGIGTSGLNTKWRSR